MQWENRENGGFSSHATWLKVNPNYEMINVKSQINSDDSLLFYYKKLIALRKSKNYADLLRDGEIKEELHQYEEIISFVRFDKKHERRLQIILHMGQNPIALSLSYKACLSTNYENMLMEERKVIIRKYEALILEV
jgi:glycosidase